MNRLCCGLVLAALSGGATAAWERVGTSDGGRTVYADAATIQRSSDVVKMWSLLDYKTAEKDDAGQAYQSVKLLHEFDCKEAKARTRYLSLHGGAMAGGRLVGSEVRSDSAWQPADNRAIGEALFRLACGKK